MSIGVLLWNKSTVLGRSLVPRSFFFILSSVLFLVFGPVSDMPAVLNVKAGDSYFVPECPGVSQVPLGASIGTRGAISAKFSRAVTTFVSGLRAPPSLAHVVADAVDRLSQLPFGIFQLPGGPLGFHAACLVALLGLVEEMQESRLLVIVAETPVRAAELVAVARTFGVVCRVTNRLTKAARSHQLMTASQSPVLAIRILYLSGPGDLARFLSQITRADTLVLGGAALTTKLSSSRCELLDRCRKLLFVPSGVGQLVPELGLDEKAVNLLYVAPGSKISSMGAKDGSRQLAPLEYAARRATQGRSIQDIWSMFELAQLVPRESFYSYRDQLCHPVLEARASTLFFPLWFNAHDPTYRATALQGIVTLCTKLHKMEPNVQWERVIDTGVFEAQSFVDLITGLSASSVSPSARLREVGRALQELLETGELMCPVCLETQPVACQVVLLQCCLNLMCRACSVQCTSGTCPCCRDDTWHVAISVNATPRRPLPSMKACVPVEAFVGTLLEAIQGASFFYQVGVLLDQLCLRRVRANVLVVFPTEDILELIGAGPPSASYVIRRDTALHEIAEIHWGMTAPGSEYVRVLFVSHLINPAHVTGLCEIAIMLDSRDLRYDVHQASTLTTRALLGSQNGVLVRLADGT